MVVVVVGVMTPPSLAGASEAVNQEMETIPSRAPGRCSVLYTLIRAKWPSSGYRVAPTPNGLPSAPNGGGGVAVVKEVARSESGSSRRRSRDSVIWRLFFSVGFTGVTVVKQDERLCVRYGAEITLCLPCPSPVQGGKRCRSRLTVIND